MLVSNLIQDVMPRVGRLPQTGITLFRAATSVQSMIFKRLLDKKSDLLATGKLFLVIPTYDYMVPLPSDFLSMAEKPRAVEVPIATEDKTYLADGTYTADGGIYAWGMESALAWFASTMWMAGTVVTYNLPSKTLVMNVTSINGSGSASSWHLSVGVSPGEPIYALDTSASDVTVGLGTKTFVTATALSLVAGQNIIMSNVALPLDTAYRTSMDPSFLDEDDRDDAMWWEKYRIYGETYETATVTPRKYKVLGTNLYVRPKVSGPVIISGRYNAKPSDLTLTTQTVPWNGFFDEVFREGVVWILTKGVSMPEVDSAFEAFLRREIDTILNSRMRIIPATHRVKRGAYL